MENHTESKNWRKIITVISIIIACAGLGFVVWQNFIKTKVSTPKIAKTAAVSDSKANLISAKEIDNWKIYSSKDYGFKLKHPTDLKDVTTKANQASLKVIAAFDKTSDYTTAYPLIRISNTDSTLSAKEFANANIVGEVSKQKDLNFASGTAYEQVNTLNGIKLKNVFLSNKKNIITLSMLISTETTDSTKKAIDNSTYITKFDNIVDSFKFTN